MLSTAVFFGIPIGTLVALWLFVGLSQLRLGRLAVVIGKATMVAVSVGSLAAYGWYERQMSPEMTIRIDVLILWPALVVTLVVTVVALRGVRISKGGAESGRSD